MPIEYVIAVKRAHRTHAPADWQRQVGRIPGVHMRTASLSSNRLIVRATAPALKELRETFGDVLHVEPVILHDTRM